MENRAGEREIKDAGGILPALTDNLESLYNEVSKDAAREWAKMPE